MLKHPKELGFRPGLTIRIGEPAHVEWKSEAGTRDVVYVALFARQRKALKKRDALKVGQTGDSLKRRWRGIAGIFKPGKKLRDNVKSDSYEVAKNRRWKRDRCMGKASRKDMGSL